MIVAALAAIVYSMRYLVLLERRIAKMDENIEKITNKVLGEEQKIEKMEKALIHEEKALEKKIKPKRR
jgi:predicted  nucleic acid-binding Zn-ribbon protein